jgi:hypothetical protein
MPAWVVVGALTPGNASLLDDEQRQALARIVESGPIPAAHGVVRWRLIDLAQWVFEAFAIAISKQTLSRELRAGLSQIVGPAASSCPGRRGRRGVQENFAASLAQIAEQEAAGQPIEIWFQML